jgi:predicted RNA-binding Zn-ribbon protein involved in translation (DUF1610 family)
MKDMNTYPYLDRTSKAPEFNDRTLYMKNDMNNYCGQCWHKIERTSRRGGQVEFVCPACGAEPSNKDYC